jgi:hypothetical protein
MHATRPAIHLTGAERVRLPTGFARASAAPVRSSAPDSATPAVLPVNSEFSFCNSNIACFVAELHYVSRTEFQLENAQLEDTLCDNRSVFADVYDQNGFLAEFRNSEGCNSTADFPTETISDPNGVAYVYIRLYACNSTSCSSVVNSRRHGNPHF